MVHELKLLNFKILLLLYVTCNDKIQQLLKLCVRHPTSLLSFFINGLKFRIEGNHSQQSSAASPVVVWKE